MNAYRLIQLFSDHPDKFRIYHNNEDRIVNNLFKLKMFNSVSMPVYSAWICGNIGYERITFMNNGIIREAWLLCGTLIFDYTEETRSWLRETILDIQLYMDFGHCILSTYDDYMYYGKFLIVSLEPDINPCIRFWFIYELLKRIQSLPRVKPDIIVDYKCTTVAIRYQRTIEQIETLMKLVNDRREHFGYSEYDTLVRKVYHQLMDLRYANVGVHKYTQILYDIDTAYHYYKYSTVHPSLEYSYKIDLTDETCLTKNQQIYFKRNMRVLLDIISDQYNRYSGFAGYIDSIFVDINQIPTTQIEKPKKKHVELINSQKPLISMYTLTHSDLYNSKSLLHYLGMIGSSEYCHEEMLKQYPDKPMRIPKKEQYVFVHYPNGNVVNSVYILTYWLNHPLLKEISITLPQRTIVIYKDVFGFTSESFYKNRMVNLKDITKARAQQICSLKNIRYAHVTLNENTYINNT